MGIHLSEHRTFYIRRYNKGEEILDSSEGMYVLETDYSIYETIASKAFNANSHRFLLSKNDNSLEIKADYCIGIDWLGATGKYLYVEPKINKSTIESFIKNTEVEKEVKPIPDSENSGHFYELDYLQMLLQVTSVSESNSNVKDLVQIDWESKQIQIKQKDDKLTPFLVVRFLQILKAIVRKGLKKNYYKVQENLNNRVKGKILVGQHIKQNIFKNRFTSTFCEYQVFGEDHLENSFLKKVLQFVNSYVENHKLLLHDNYKIISETINFCRPAFEMISDDIPENKLKHFKHNPFYKDYKDALQIGSHILKRFAYNITTTSSSKVSTPPFWIDMPKLFELYVYSKMIADNQVDKAEILYQFSTYGNALDILVSQPFHQMVIDAKYKLHYKWGQIHQDIRQVAGYARLKKVREKLKITDDRNIDCLIIYPDMDNGVECLSMDNIFKNRKEIAAYDKVYKLGIKLPHIS